MFVKLKEIVNTINLKRNNFFIVSTIKNKNKKLILLKKFIQLIECNGPFNS